MGIIIPFKRPEKKERICSFCKKTESQVKRMFSNGLEGPQAKNICNECVGHARSG